MTNKQRDLSVLSYIIRNPDNFFQFQDRLQEFHFDYQPAKTIFPFLMRTYNKNLAMPTQTELEWLVQASPSFKDAPVVSQQAVLNVIEEIYSSESTEATGNILAEFIIFKELQYVSDSIDESLKQPDYSKKIDFYKEKIEALEMLSSHSYQNEIIFPFSADSISTFAGDMIEMSGGGVIRTPFSKYNARSRGGVFRGDSTIIMGSTNIGKSTFLVSLGVYWAFEGYRVLYYGIDTAKDEIRERLFVRAANKPLSEDYTYEDLQTDVADRLGENLNFTLRLFPAASVTPQDLFRDYYKVKAALNRLTGDPTIDIVIVDYGDQLIPKRKYEAKRHELAGIFTDLAGFAQKEQIHLLTATQANRAALRKPVVTLEDIAEAYAKAHPAANVWAICQSDAEYHNQKFRLGVIKSRRGPKNYLIPMTVRYETQLVAQDPDMHDVLWITRDTSQRIGQEVRKPETMSTEQAVSKLSKELQGAKK